MIPQTRTDLFLAKITGEDVTLPEPQTRFELYLANCAGESYELPAPNSRATLYLAKILGQDVELPEPQTRSELYLASIAGMSVQLPEAPATREEWYLARWAEDAGYVTITGNPVTFNAVAAKLKQLKIAFSPVQEGSGDPSPENQRPIHGWTGVNVWDDPYYGGLIEWNQTVQNGDFSDGTTGWTTSDASATASGGVATIVATAQGGRIYRNASTPAGHVILIHADVKATAGTVYQVGSWYSAAYYTEQTANGEWQSIDHMFTPSSGTSLPIAVQDRRTEGWDGIQAKNITCFDLTVMFGAGNEPATVAEFRELFPLDYYAYNAGTETTVGAVNGNPGWHVEIEFDETYYSGWADPTTGVLTVDYGAYVLDGVTNKASNLFGPVPSDSQYVNVIGKYAVQLADLANNTPYGAANYYRCSHFVWKSYASRRTVGPDQITWYSSSRVVEWFSDSFTTLDEFNGYLANRYANGTPVTLVYELATPITIQLTPQQVSSLAGVNNIWTDADTLTVEYRKDGNVSDVEALSMLLGGRYTPAQGPEDVPDAEALRIIAGR